MGLERAWAAREWHHRRVGYRRQPRIPTKSSYFYTYDVLVLAVAKANTDNLGFMMAEVPEMVGHLARLSYGKLRLKVDAAPSTYLATAADLGCTNDLQQDPRRVLNFALARAAASGLNLSRYAHLITWFDYDLVSNFGCDLTGASGGMVNGPNQAGGSVPPVGPSTGWLKQMPQGVTAARLPRDTRR